jgi:hypothetical protein
MLDMRLKKKMSPLPAIETPRLQVATPRFGVATAEFKAYYRDFLQQKVLINPLNTDAFFLIDQLRRNEPHKKRGRLALHDQLSIYLTQGDFKPLFSGLDTFVKELRQLLVVAGKIPWFVPWIPIKGRPYHLDAEHKTMAKEEAKNRLDSIRVVIIEQANQRNKA